MIISEDFSKNYSLKQQNEIMSAHWSQEEFRLFCATVHYLCKTESLQSTIMLCVPMTWLMIKNTIFFDNYHIINDLKSKGLIFDIFHLLLHQRGHGMPADWNFFVTLHRKGENDGAGWDVKNAVWRKVLQNKAVAGDLESFASIAKEKFPNFTIEGFKLNEICDATKHLPERYKKHSKHLASTQKFHHVATENKKVVGYFLIKTCPCHHQIEQNQE